MKKELKKFLVICICIFCVICQLLTGNVYADTIEEIKQEADFKTVEQDGEPAQYDFLIDANDLIKNEQLPEGIKTTIDDIVYKEESFLNVDFFGKTNTNNDVNAERQEYVRGIVRNVYRVLLYISFAAMLVLLIYMAIKIVSSGISPNINLGREGKNGSPKEQVKIRKLMEQWVTTVASLVLAVFVMSFLVGLSSEITSIVTNNSTDDSSSITVYVKNSKFNANAPILNASGTSTSTNTASGTIPSTTNDSTLNAATLREKVINQAKLQDNLGVSPGMCARWVRLTYNKALNKSIQSYCCAHNAALHAINASTDSSNIIPGAAVFSYRSSSGKIDGNCGMDAGHVGIYLGNGQIASCTGRGKNGITICTIEEWKQSWDFSCWGWIPGTEELADGATAKSTNSSTNLSTNTNGSSSSSSNKTKNVDYYFKTSLDGLFLFESQYDFIQHPVKAINSIIGGFLLIIAKWCIYAVLFVRMVILAIISATMPIIILKNAFDKASGNKSTLKKYIKLYLYWLILKPAIAFLYYIMIQSNVYLVNQFPLYILFVLIALVIMFVISLRLLRRNLRT